MKMVSAAKARNDFATLPKKAAAGERFGIRYGKKVLKLGPSPEEDTSYAEKEYGVTKAELKRFEERMDAKIKRDRKAGKYKVYTGGIEELIKD